MLDAEACGAGKGGKAPEVVRAGGTGGEAKSRKGVFGLAHAAPGKRP